MTNVRTLTIVLILLVIAAPAQAQHPAPFAELHLAIDWLGKHQPGMAADLSARDD